jgi:AcrR family transcriptional regulator
MTERPMRADARRNRDRIIEVAAAAFASAGPDAYLEDIARDSGVGIGTVYRHFPTRDALFVAVHRAEITRIAGRAADLLGQHPPGRALELWLAEFLGFMQAKRGMAEVFRSIMTAGDNPFLDLRAAVTGAASRLLAAVADGTTRPPADPLDLLVLVHGISLATDDPDQAQRLLKVITSGLAGPPARPPAGC